MSLENINAAENLILTPDLETSLKDEIYQEFNIPSTSFTWDNPIIKGILSNLIKSEQDPYDEDFIPTDNLIETRFPIWLMGLVNKKFESYRAKEIEKAHKEHAKPFLDRLEAVSQNNVAYVKAYGSVNHWGVQKQAIENFLLLDHDYAQSEIEISKLENAMVEVQAELEEDNLILEVERNMAFGKKVIAKFVAMNKADNLDHAASKTMAQQMVDLKTLLESGSLSAAKIEIQNLPLSPVFTQEKKDKLLAMFN